MAIAYISGPELSRRQAGAALAEALDVLVEALPRTVELARDEERAAERAAVVAWLREHGMAPYAQSNLDYAATMIERGEHRREETE